MPRDTMNSLELVRRLYEGEKDPDALAKELDESAMEELRQLVEAKDALEALPRRKPPQRLVDAVVAEAMRNERPSPLMLILNNRTLQRMAAAAVVVVAIGVGYLTLTRTGIGPLDAKDEPAFSNEAPAVSEKRQDLGKEADEDGALADTEMERSNLAGSKPAAPAAPEPAKDDVGAFRSRDFNEVGAMAEAEPPAEEAGDDHFAVSELQTAFGDTSLKEEGAEARELLTWDQEEEALRTLFWQVQALENRSPGDDWEEAVPLEGSFEMLEKQQPGGKRWLQTGSQR